MQPEAAKVIERVVAPFLEKRNLAICPKDSFGNEVCFMSLILVHHFSTLFRTIITKGEQYDEVVVCVCSLVCDWHSGLQ